MAKQGQQSIMTTQQQHKNNVNIMIPIIIKRMVGLFFFFGLLAVFLAIAFVVKGKSIVLIYKIKFKLLNVRVCPITVE